MSMLQNIFDLNLCKCCIRAAELGAKSEPPFLFNSVSAMSVTVTGLTMTTVSLGSSRLSGVRSCPHGPGSGPDRPHRSECPGQREGGLDPIL